MTDETTPPPPATPTVPAADLIRFMLQVGADAMDERDALTAHVRRLEAEVAAARAEAAGMRGAMERIANAEPGYVEDAMGKPADCYPCTELIAEARRALAIASNGGKLPTLDDIHAMNPKIPGGMTPEEYIDDLRGEEDDAAAAPGGAHESQAE